MGSAFWDQVESDTAALLSSSEAAEEILITEGSEQYAITGIFEDAYTEIEGEGKIPVPTRYTAIRIYEGDLPVRLQKHMQVTVRGETFAIAQIHNPRKNRQTVVELTG
ncbi:MAG: hypothetical protein K9L75_06600 [Spirochaetia bacterium]|nr:hypothetical protein [Spirochaetia bacterium]